MSTAVRADTTTEAPARWTGVVAGLLAVLLVTFTAFGAVVPIVPGFVLDRLDGSRFVVGLAFAASGLAALLFRPYAGRMAQRFGGRPVMTAGCALAAIVGGLYAIPAGQTGFIVTRVVMGIAESLVFTAGSVWIVTLAPIARRAQIIGYYGLAMWCGWTLGPLVGQALLSGPGYGGVWILAAVMPAVGGIIVACLPRHVTNGAAVAGRLVPRPVILPGTALALSSFGYAALTGFVALHLAARGVGHGALMISLFGTAYVVVRVIFGRVPDRVGPGPVAAFCGLGEAIGLTLIAFAHQWWLAALGSIIMGGGFTLLYPALALAVIRRTPEAERGAALGAYTSFWDLGLGASGLIAGGIAQQVGYVWVFVVSAVLAAAAAAMGFPVAQGAPPPAAAQD
jgi:MFS family permease